MAPPIGKSGNIYSDAPIRDWEQVSAYDTAGECETGRQEVWGKAGNAQKRLAESGRKAMSDNAKKFIGDVTKTLDLVDESNLYIRCVPAEAVFPPPRSPK